MKKGKTLSIVTVLFLAIASAVLGWSFYSVRPFEAINADEIEEIKAYAIPPGKEVFLSKAEVESVVPLLQDLKVSKPGYQLFTVGLGGQTVRFTVRKSDGSIIVISNVGNALITIDNKSYQADYESAEAINQFANKVLGTGF